MKYKITTDPSQSNYLTIEVTFSNLASGRLEVQLPAWRPGRYELQNFAKNIQSFEAFGTNGQPLGLEKLTKDRWQIQAAQQPEITIRYRYFAHQSDAGGSFVDKNLLYVNPVNCCLYTDEQLNEPCEVYVAGRADQTLAGGIKSTFANGFHHFTADDFYHLVDTPFMLSTKLQHGVYEVNGISFHIWVAGRCLIPWERLLRDFEQFTQMQLNVFGEFPESDYHFLLWILPTPYYHGVEHRNSTMMVLGPDTQPFEEMYVDLLGLASHELFHAWNVCKIRPIELMPYDFTRENYFKTCFVAEGITTFYGDWMLYRAGVFDEKQYRNELETCYRRHFETGDAASQSLLAASFDLWLDGYTRSIPNRKVSVYHKGAIAAQILNFLLEKAGKSLDDVMKLMWLRHGKPFVGYTYQDYKNCCEEVIGYDLSEYFERCIAGTDSLWNDVDELLAALGWRLNRNREGIVSLTTQL